MKDFFRRMLAYLMAVSMVVGNIFSGALTANAQEYYDRKYEFTGHGSFSDINGSMMGRFDVVGLDTGKHIGAYCIDKRTPTYGGVKYYPTSVASAFENYSGINKNDYGKYENYLIGVIEESERQYRQLTNNKGYNDQSPEVLNLTAATQALIWDKLHGTNSLISGNLTYTADLSYDKAVEAEEIVRKNGPVTVVYIEEENLDNIFSQYRFNVIDKYNRRTALTKTDLKSINGGKYHAFIVDTYSLINGYYQFNSIEVVHKASNIAVSNLRLYGYKNSYMNGKNYVKDYVKLDYAEIGFNKKTNSKLENKYRELDRYGKSYEQSNLNTGNNKISIKNMDCKEQNGRVYVNYFVKADNSKNVSDKYAEDMVTYLVETTANNKEIVKYVEVSNLKTNYFGEGIWNISFNFDAKTYETAKRLEVYNKVIISESTEKKISALVTKDYTKCYQNLITTVPIYSKQEACCHAEIKEAPGKVVNAVKRWKIGDDKVTGFNKFKMPTIRIGLFEVNGRDLKFVSAKHLMFLNVASFYDLDHEKEYTVRELERITAEEYRKNRNTAEGYKYIKPAPIGGICYKILEEGDVVTLEGRDYTVSYPEIPIVSLFINLIDNSTEQTKEDIHIKVSKYWMPVGETKTRRNINREINENIKAVLVEETEDGYELVDSVDLNRRNRYSAEFKDLTKYDPDKGTYKIFEVAETTEETEKTVTIDGKYYEILDGKEAVVKVGNDRYKVAYLNEELTTGKKENIITNTKLPKDDNTEITIEKHWKDGPSANATFNLYREGSDEVLNTVTLNEDNSTHTFSTDSKGNALPMYENVNGADIEIKYTVKEAGIVNSEGEDVSSKYNHGELPEIHGLTKNEKGVFVNVFTDNPKTEISVIKTWSNVDTVPTDEVKIQLVKNITDDKGEVKQEVVDEALLTSKADNGHEAWTWTFTDLDQKDEKGNPIDYEVIELWKAEDYKVSYGKNSIVNGKIYDLSIDNSKIYIPKPEMGTTVIAGESRADMNNPATVTSKEGAKGVEVTDIIRCSNFEKGSSYVFRGQLVDITEGKEEVIKTVYNPHNYVVMHGGEEFVTMDFGKIRLKPDHRYVVYERAVKVEDNSENIIDHKDFEKVHSEEKVIYHEENVITQTITVAPKPEEPKEPEKPQYKPEMGTVAGLESKGKELRASEENNSSIVLKAEKGKDTVEIDRLFDTVKYTDFEKGTYIIEGELMEVDSNGKETPTGIIGKTEKLVIEKDGTSGEIVTEFYNKDSDTITLKYNEGHKYVIYETAYKAEDNSLYAQHREKDSETQTIRIEREKEREHFYKTDQNGIAAPGARFNLIKVIKETVITPITDNITEIKEKEVPLKAAETVAATEETAEKSTEETTEKVKEEAAVTEESSVKEELNKAEEKEVTAEKTSDKENKEPLKEETVTEEKKQEEPVKEEVKEELKEEAVTDETASIKKDSETDENKETVTEKPEAEKPETEEKTEAHELKKDEEVIETVKEKEELIFKEIVSQGDGKLDMDLSKLDDGLYYLEEVKSPDLNGRKGSWKEEAHKKFTFEIKNGAVQLVEGGEITQDKDGSYIIHNQWIPEKEEPPVTPPENPPVTPPYYPPYTPPETPYIPDEPVPQVPEEDAIKPEKIVEIEDEPVVLKDKDDDNTVIIPDEEIPLQQMPKTGESNSGSYLALTMAGAAMGGLLISGKKKRKNNS